MFKKIGCVAIVLFLLAGCSEKGKEESSFNETATVSSETTIITTTVAPETSESVTVENPDFRSVKWGMTKKEVKSSENLVVVEEDNESVLFSDVKVSSLAATLLYSFDGDYLYKAAYFFDISHTNNNLYVGDYKTLKETYTKKYGSPIEEKEVWLNNLFKNDADGYGTALSLGHLVYTSTWESGNTSIMMMLFGDNYEVHLVVTYSEIDHEVQTDDFGI